MMSANMGRPLYTPQLTEQVAVDLGVNLLGELTLFFLAAVVTLSEYFR